MYKSDGDSSLKKSTSFNRTHRRNKSPSKYVNQRSKSNRENNSRQRDNRLSPRKDYKLSPRSIETIPQRMISPRGVTMAPPSPRVLSGRGDVGIEIRFKTGGTRVPRSNKVLREVIERLCNRRSIEVGDTKAIDASNGKELDMDLSLTELDRSITEIYFGYEIPKGQYHIRLYMADGEVSSGLVQSYQKLEIYIKTKLRIRGIPFNRDTQATDALGNPVSLDSVFHYIVEKLPSAVMDVSSNYDGYQICELCYGTTLQKFILCRGKKLIEEYITGLSLSREDTLLFLLPGREYTSKPYLINYDKTLSQVLETVIRSRGHLNLNMELPVLDMSGNEIDTKMTLRELKDITVVTFGVSDILEWIMNHLGHLSSTEYSKDTTVDGPLYSLSDKNDFLINYSPPVRLKSPEAPISPKDTLPRTFQGDLETNQNKLTRQLRRIDLKSKFMINKNVHHHRSHGNWNPEETDEKLLQQFFSSESEYCKQQDYCSVPYQFCHPLNETIGERRKSNPVDDFHTMLHDMENINGEYDNWKKLYLKKLVR
eukprot:TRINITY_DN11227_c0_g1_i1.p1 TRINITY_DN11227_c0_g1~~TRINITY_DN11227_c0_g1_i1.p1  ORF type:complete len:539 (-),score=103.96 TRINITY_DN11227_c0_g1_i1:123-1739(-)